jgi:rsbT antagonist protein RsbS
MANVTRIPIIRLYGNLIVSIQVSLSDKLVNQLKDDITEAVERSDAQGLIVDVSGVDVMDSYISRALRDIGVIVRLMGVSTVISGMHPIIAMTLVQMGLDLKGMRSALNLESAIDMLAESRREETALALAAAAP